MADKPWTESNISVNERARRVVSHNRDFNSTGVMVQTATEAIEAAVRDALAETGPKWIPVSERLPQKINNEAQTVIILRECGSVNTGWYGNGDKYWRTAYDDFIHDIDEEGLVTHWMPLPEPPSE